MWSGEEINFLPLLGIEPLSLGLPARSLVAAPTGFCHVYTGFQLRDLEGPLEAVHSRSYFTVVLSMFQVTKAVKRMCAVDVILVQPVPEL
jgi:hypothetical protein